MSKITVRDVPDLKAGEKIIISAVLTEWIPQGNNRKPPFISWIIKKGKGEIDQKNGMFTAPILREGEDNTTEVLVKAQDGSAENTKTITTKVAKPIEIFPKNVNAMVSEQINFSFKSKFDVNARFELVKPSPENGSIDPKTGVYVAPKKIGNKTKVQIRVFDQNIADPSKKTNSDIAIVTLLPIEIKADIQTPVKAGKNKAKLPIRVINDINGEDNFTCRIINSTRPIGRLEANGIYWPPFQVNQQETITVEAISKTDSSKKVIFDFIVQ